MADTLSHKERTRARILDEAASAMRTHGPGGIGVAALMKRAGLTHGGFYAHFSSRDDLVAHAVDRMFADSSGMLARHLDGAEPKAGLSALIDHYVSDRARLAPERGCPIPGLAGEAGRMPTAARARFEAGIVAFRARMAAVLAAMGRPDADSLASSALAEMSGAVAMARAMTDDAIASEILARSRQQLKQRLGLI